MNLNTSSSAQWLFGVWGTPRDSYWCIKPIYFKINDIDPERRFVNLFSKFSPLCDSLPEQSDSATEVFNRLQNFQPIIADQMNWNSWLWLIQIVIDGRKSVCCSNVLLSNDLREIVWVYMNSVAGVGVVKQLFSCESIAHCYFAFQHCLGFIGTLSKKNFWNPARDSWGPH